MRGSRSRNSQGIIQNDEPVTPNTGAGQSIPQKRRSREEVNMAAGGAGGEPLSARYSKRGGVQAASGDWLALETSRKGAASAPLSETSVGSSGTMSRPSSQTPTPSVTFNENLCFSCSPPIGLSSPSSNRPATPSTPVASATKHVDISADSKGCGTRLMDLGLLLAWVEKSTCCRRCTQGIILQTLDDFVSHVENSEEDGDSTLADKLLSFKRQRSAWRSGDSFNLDMPHLELKKEDRFGAASVLTFQCTRHSVHAAYVGREHGDKRALGGNVHVSKLLTSRRDTSVRRQTSLKRMTTGSFGVNKRLGFGLMAIGRGSVDLHTLFSHLDMPISLRFALKGADQFRGVMVDVGGSIEAVAEESCLEAMADEVALTKKKEVEERAAATAAAAAAAATVATTLSFRSSSSSSSSCDGGGGGDGRSSSSSSSSSTNRGGGGGCGKKRRVAATAEGCAEAASKNDGSEEEEEVGSEGDESSDDSTGQDRPRVDDGSSMDSDVVSSKEGSSGSEGEGSNAQSQVREGGRRQ